MKVFVLIMDKGNKTAKIILRTTIAEKQRYKTQAASYGISLTELICSSLNNLQVKDYSKEKEMKILLDTLIREINHIGNNINQATVTLHQLRISGLPESGEILAFNELLRQYQKLMEEYKILIWKFFK